MYKICLTTLSSAIWWIGNNSFIDILERDTDENDDRNQSQMDCH